MKVMFICKKHYKELMKEVKQADPLPLGATENIGAIGYLYGVNFRVYIKPYLKKIKIIDMPEYKLKTPFTHEHI